MSYSITRLSRKYAGICAYYTVGREPSLYLYVIMCTVYLSTSVLRFQKDQFHTQLVVCISFKRRSVSDLDSHNKSIKSN
jgi:hypothetical protein